VPAPHPMARGIQNVSSYSHRQAHLHALGWVRSTRHSVPLSGKNRQIAGQEWGFDLVPLSPLNRSRSQRNANADYLIQGEPHYVLLFGSGFVSGAYSDRSCSPGPRTAVLWLEPSPPAATTCPDVVTGY